MTLILREGDLFASGLPALAHGCNCQGVMGAGIAVGFRERWPDMYAEYRRRCDQGSFRLGSAMMWRRPWTQEDRTRLTVFNLGTQQAPGSNASIHAVAASVARMVCLAEMSEIKTIGMPWIGCGIGGLQRERVHEALSVFADWPSIELVLYDWTPPKEGRT